MASETNENVEVSRETNENNEVSRERSVLGVDNAKFNIYLLRYVQLHFYYH